MAKTPTASEEPVNPDAARSEEIRAQLRAVIEIYRLPAAERDAREDEARNVRQTLRNLIREGGFPETRMDVILEALWEIAHAENTHGELLEEIGQRLPEADLSTAQGIDLFAQNIQRIADGLAKGPQALRLLTLEVHRMREDMSRLMAGKTEPKHEPDHPKKPEHEPEPDHPKKPDHEPELHPTEAQKKEMQKWPKNEKEARNHLSEVIHHVLDHLSEGEEDMKKQLEEKFGKGFFTDEELKHITGLLPHIHKNLFMRNEATHQIDQIIAKAMGQADERSKAFISKEQKAHDHNGDHKNVDHGKDHDHGKNGHKDHAHDTKHGDGHGKHAHSHAGHDHGGHGHGHGASLFSPRYNPVMKLTDESIRESGISGSSAAALLDWFGPHKAGGDTHGDHGTGDHGHEKEKGDHSEHGKDDHAHAEPTSGFSNPMISGSSRAALEDFFGPPKKKAS